MKKYVKVLYGISLTLVIFMLVLFHKYVTIEEYNLREEVECNILTDYEVTSYENDAAPIGITQEYKWTLTDIPKRGGVVTFYVIHQEIEIYIDNEQIYSLTADKNNRFSSTVGCDWAKAYLYPEDEGKEIRILVHPIYETSIGNDLTIYYGNHDTICSKIVQNNLPIWIIGTLMIVIGFAFILFVLIAHRNHDIDTSISMLGVFSIFAGLWKISDMTAAPLLFGDTTTLSAISLISISMMVLPYVFYIRNQFGQSHHRLWNFLCVGNSLVVICNIILQLTGVADLRQTLILCHVGVVVAIVGILIALIEEMRHNKLSPKLHITAVCCLLCLLGTALDMVVYYHSGDSGSMIYCLLAFLVYIISMGYMSVREAMRLMERGREAKKYEHMAMHDALTGLYNRAFYSRYLAENDILQTDSYIIMFDVNNLKQCNDTVGHDCGDRLLQNSANILKQAFRTTGKCFRIGGDEFCVILRHIDEDACLTCLKNFDKLLMEFNQSHPDEFPVRIAYGYAHYNAEKDFDFGDTLRRADKKMYQKKASMKAETENL